MILRRANSCLFAVAAWMLQFRSGSTELEVLIADGWPARWMTLPTGASLSNRLMTANLTEAFIAQHRFNATVFFGGLPDNHAGPNFGVFDRSHPKNLQHLNKLFPAWRQNLENFINPALPMIADGRISGLFVGDEIACADVSFANISAVLRHLRHLVGPRPKIWMNECGHPSGWPYATWPYFPSEIDYLSIDSYNVKDAAAEVDAVKRFWSLERVRTKLLAHQKILVTPGTFACSNGAYQSLAEADAVVVTKLKAYMQWAQDDNRLIGMWPWHLTNRTKSQNSGPCDMRLGCEALPGCILEMRKLGAQLRNETIPSPHRFAED